MNLFQHSSGIIIAFGFNMKTREPDPSFICWSDFNGKTWEPDVANAAGDLRWAGAGSAQFIKELANKVIAFAPGHCLEMELIGQPFIFSASRLTPDKEEIG
jgi:hypothetical protein